MKKMRKDNELSLEKLIKLFPHLEQELKHQSKLPLFAESLNLPKYTERTRLLVAHLYDEICAKEYLDRHSYEFTWTQRRGIAIDVGENNRHYRSQFGTLEIDVVDVNSDVNTANKELLNNLRYLREIMNKNKHYCMENSK